MDQEQLDTQFRKRFKESELQIDEEALARAVCDGLPAGERPPQKSVKDAPFIEATPWEVAQTRTTQTDGRRRTSKTGEGSRLRRGLVFGVVTLAVLVALGFGVRALVERLGQNRSVVVITDDPMSLIETGSSVSMVEGVYRLNYGQTVNIDGLDITVTIRPTLVPLTESDPHPIRSFPTERDDWRLRSRLRSQYIITNTGSEPQMVDLRRFLVLGEDGNRYSLMAQTLELQPGGTLWGRLDFYVDNGVAANTVVYTTDQITEDLAVWGPEAITEGPGYPVLQTLPTLRADDVESIEVQEEDPNGGQPSIETYAPNAAADLETFISYYEQTTLLRSEGYPGYASPIQFTFHLKDGSDLIVGIGSEDEERIRITHASPSQMGNPPSAVGVNPALVDIHYNGRFSKTTTTYGVAPTTDDPPLSSTTTITGAVGPRLSWGEEAILDGRTIKVEQPVEAPDETGAPSGFVLVYSLVTITNTGSEPLTCAAAEFSLDGNSSGSTGIGGLEKTLAGHEVLDLVTLQPGESVKVAVRFCVKQGDHPVKVRLGTRSSTGRIYSSTSEWLASWQ